VTVDRHYTPSWLADRLALELPEGFVGTILDPTAGAGSLLLAAERRFGGSAKLFGIDSDRRAHAALLATAGVASSSRADFLNHRALASTKVFRNLSRIGLDWILLNPPFSYRGGGGIIVTLDGSLIRLPTALAFVWRAMTAIVPREGIVALLPVGVLTSARGSRFMSWASRSWEISEPIFLGGKAFAEATVEVVLVRFERRRRVHGVATPEGRQSKIVASEAPEGECSCVEVIRGRVPVAQVRDCKPGAIPFVHTRDVLFADGGRDSFRQSEGRWSSGGVLLVLPRVGNPLSFRVRAIDGPVVLSDCVYALRFRSIDRRQWLERQIQRRLPELLNRYEGSGAKHLTIPRLREFLETVGAHATHVPASGDDFVCRCPSSIAARS
jgi:hypothetical protein